ncbi:hypothetical protein KCU90_g7218, partial [Aureobasidium melanogenum]
MQPKIPRIIEPINRNIRGIPHSHFPNLIKPHHPGAARRPPMNHLGNARRARPAFETAAPIRRLRQHPEACPLRKPSHVHLGNHIGRFVRGRAVDANRYRHPRVSHFPHRANTAAQPPIALRTMRDTGARLRKQRDFVGVDLDQMRVPHIAAKPRTKPIRRRGKPRRKRGVESGRVSLEQRLEQMMMCIDPRRINHAVSSVHDRLARSRRERTDLVDRIAHNANVGTRHARWIVRGTTATCHDRGRVADQRGGLSVVCRHKPERKESKLAIVPAAQTDARHPRRDGEQYDARHGDQQQRRKEPGNIQLKTRLQNLIGQPRAAAARSRDELGDHRTDQRQPA